MRYISQIQQILVRLRRLEEQIGIGGDYYLRPVVQYFFRRPGGVDSYFRPDGTSYFIRS